MNKKNRALLLCVSMLPGMLVAPPKKKSHRTETTNKKHTLEDRKKQLKKLLEEEESARVLIETDELQERKLLEEQALQKEKLLVQKQTEQERKIKAMREALARRYEQSGRPGGFVDPEKDKEERARKEAEEALHRAQKEAETLVRIKRQQELKQTAKEMRKNTQLSLEQALKCVCEEIESKEMIRGILFAENRIDEEIAIRSELDTLSTKKDNLEKQIRTINDEHTSDTDLPEEVL